MRSENPRINDHDPNKGLASSEQSDSKSGRVIYQEEKVENDLSALSDLIRKAIEANRTKLADSNSKWDYTPLWWFSKRIKGEWPDLEADKAADRIEPALRKLYPDQSNPWLAAFPEIDDPREEFIDTWPEIKRPGKSIVKDAWRLAQKEPVSHLLNIRQGTIEAKYADLAYQMEILQPGNWWTPQALTARLLGCDKTGIWRAQSRLEKKGVILKTKKGFFQSGQQGSCAHFKFDKATHDSLTKARRIPTRPKTPYEVATEIERLFGVVFYYRQDVDKMRENGLSEIAIAVITHQKSHFDRFGECTKHDLPFKLLALCKDLVPEIYQTGTPTNS